MQKDLKLILNKLIEYSLAITNPPDNQSWLIYVLEFTSNLRILSFVFEPITIQTSNQESPMNLLSLIGRPQLLLNNNPLYTYSIKVFYILLVIFEGVLIKFLHDNRNRRSLDLDLIQDNIILYIGNTLFKYNTIIFHYPLVLNIVEYALINISQSQISFLLLNYCNIVIILIHYIFISYYLSESILLYNNKCYDMINTNFIDKIISILQIIQVIIYTQLTSAYHGIIYQSFISIILSALQVLVVSKFYKNSNDKVINLKIIVNSVIFSVSVETFISEFFNVNLHYSYMYIIPVLIVVLLQKQPRFQMFKLFTDQQISILELRYLTSKFIEYYIQNQQSQSSSDQKFFNIKFQIILSQHKDHDGLIQKILMRYKQIQADSKQPNINIGAIQLLVQCDKLIEAYQLINSILNKQIQFKYQVRQQKDISLRERNYLQILFIQVRSKINANMISKYHGKQQNEEDISNAIQELIHLENTKLSIVNDIQQSIKLKIKMLSQLLLGNAQPRIIYEQTRIAIEFVSSVLKELQKRYKEYSTLENQKYLLFFQIEVLNDYQDAFEISQLNAMEEDIKRLVRSNLISQLTKSTYYAMITEVIDTQHIMITHTTSNINKLVNENLIGKQINQLIPNFALPQHHKLVEEFFRTGVNRYYQKLNNMSLQLAPNVNIAIDMIMDINQRQTNSIEVIILLKPIENAPLYLILNKNYEIQDLSESLIFTLFSQFTKGLAQYFNQVPVQYFIPNIEKNMYFKAQTTYLRIPSIGQLQTSSTNHSLIEIWTNLGIYIDLLCSFVIEEHEIQEEVYFKLIFNDINKAMKDIPITLFNENVQIDTPFEDNNLNIELIRTNRESLNMITLTDRQMKQQLQSQVYQTNVQLLSQQQLEVIDEEKHQINHKEHNFDPLEMGSQMSSVGAFKMSKFYKHFSIIHTFASSVRSNHIFNQFKLVVLLYFLLVIVDNALILKESGKIYSLTDDISLLSIKNDVLEPIENFLVTRYTNYNYQVAQFVKQITATTYNQLIQFPNSNLVLGYDDAKESILSLLDLPQFQPFLQNRYFTVMQLKMNITGYTGNYTFRSVMEQFLNYQYSFRLAYTVKTLDTSSAYFYYSYMNYLLIYNTFDELNEFVLEQSQTSSKMLQQNSINTLIPLKVLYVLVTIWLIILYYQNGMVFNKFQIMFMNLPKEFITMELRRLQKIESQITKLNFINTYYPDVIEKEKELILKQEDFQRVKQKNPNNETLVIHNFTGYIVIAVTVLIPIILTLVINFSTNLYYTKYIETTIFYKQVSDLGVDIPTMYGQRDVCYWSRTFAFMTSTQVLALKAQIFTCINRTSHFSAILQNFQPTNYLFNQQAIQYLQNITDQNLCNYLSPNFTKKAASFCNQTLNGALTKGLSITLTTMINSLTTEYKINNFTNRTVYPMLELEGVFLASQSVQTLLEQMKSNIISFTIDLQRYIIIICVVCLIVQSLITFTIIIFYNEYEHRRYTSLKRMIYLFPQCTLLYDQSFHREISSLIVQYQIK